MEANCVASGYIGQFEHVIHGDGSGKVHRQERGNSFGGNSIFSLYQTPYYYMEDPEIRKVVHKVNTYLKSEGDTEVFVGVSYDYDDTRYKLTLLTMTSLQRVQLPFMVQLYMEQVVYMMVIRHLKHLQIYRDQVTLFHKLRYE